ncbi:unnamed protein product [Closterium sp. NIES-65]|nr:unnamed protein product [Closterium sp. NIES-65]
MRSREQIRHLHSQEQAVHGEAKSSSVHSIHFAVCVNSFRAMALATAAALLRRSSASSSSAADVMGAMRLGASALLQHRAAFSSSSSQPTAIDMAWPASLQKARSWDDGVATNFATSSLADVFKGRKVVIFGVPGAFTGVCSKAHVPGYLAALPELKAKGVDAVLCTAVNDPYTLHAWANQLQAHDKIDFYADFDGSFHRHLGLQFDCSGALLGMRSNRWAAVVENGLPLFFSSFHLSFGPSLHIQLFSLSPFLCSTISTFLFYPLS